MTKKIIYIATGNDHKLGEFHEMLKDISVKIQGLSDLRDYRPPDETGGTFGENSRLKAKSLFEYLTQKRISFDFVLADDSGLLCDDLEGDPGIHSARYAGPDSTASENNAKLIAELQKVTHVTRAARFSCVLTLIAKDGTEIQFEGTCGGLITLDPKGAHGFGYDPLFYLPEFNKTMAELAPAIKNKISHRGRAFQQLRKFLSHIYNFGPVC